MYKTTMGRMAQNTLKENAEMNSHEITVFNKHKKNMFLFLLIIFFLWPEISTAKVFLDPINSSFKSGAGQWQSIVSSYAQSLFWKLVLLDFTWTTIVWVKDRKEFGEILTGIIGKILTIGFFFSLLLSASDWIPAIINSFSDLGKAAATAAGADVGTLDSVFFTGLDLANEMLLKLADKDIFERIYLIIPTAFACICASIGFALIAGQLLVTLIESYIAIYAGIIMLGFGGSRWTSEMATAYLKFAVGTGVKLMLCYMVIGLGFNLFVNAIPGDMLNDPAAYLFYTFHVVALVLIYVYAVFNIPGLASGMLSGSPNMSLGGMAGAAITAGAGLAGAGAIAGSMGGKAGSMLGSAAAEAGGAGKALKAGFDQNRSSGMGFGESAMKAPVPGIKSAASMVGAKAVEAGKSLAEGGKGMLGKAGDAINNSAGGKVASNINGGSAGSAADSSGANNSAPVAGGGYPGGLAGDLAASENASGGSASSSGGSNNISQASSGGDSGTSSSPSSNAGGDQGMVGANAVEAGKSLVEGGKGMLGKAGDAINNSAGGKVASNINGGNAGSAADSSGANNSAPVAGGGYPGGLTGDLAANENASSGSASSGGGSNNISQASSGGDSGTSSSPSSNAGGDQGMVGAKAVEAGKSLAEGGKGMLGKAGDAINNSAGSMVASNINGGNAGSAADSSGANNSAPVAGGGYPGGLAGDLAASENASGGATANSDVGSGTSSGLIDTSSNLQSALGSRAASSGAPGKTGGTPSSSGGSASSGGGTSNNSQASSGGDSGAASSSPSGNAGGGQGDASGASVGSSDPHTKLLESINANLEAMANGPEQAKKLHQKISSLRDFVPNDGATVQTSGISMGHTRD